MSTLFNRTAIVALAYSLVLGLTGLSHLQEGIGLHGSLLHITNISQIFHIFIIIVSILILQLTSFMDKKVESKEERFLDIYKKTIKKIEEKNLDHLNIIEYPLILLFVVCGAILLMSTNDLVSIFLSIELQSYGLYLISTIYRNSELATSGGLIYFLLGGK
jgi:NADH-ubiquinone oxidoreductase chain 2